MKRLLRDFKNNNIEELKKHLNFHQVDRENRFFKKLFEEEQNNVFHGKQCVRCKEFLATVKSKLRHDFLKHYEVGFIKGKMLMFAKLSLKSFIYDMIDVFSFPYEEVKQIYNFYQIEKCFLYQNLTDTDSTSLFFNFACKVDCCVPESEARKIIFECIGKSKIARRLDISNSFWKQFDMHNSKTKKEMGLYETESVDNLNICTIAINSKEYFEKFRDRTINKKHKGVRRDAPGMNFESYASQITPLVKNYR